MDSSFMLEKYEDDNGEHKVVLSKLTDLWTPLYTRLITDEEEKQRSLEELSSYIKVDSEAIYLTCTKDKKTWFIVTENFKKNTVKTTKLEFEKSSICHLFFDKENYLLGIEASFGSRFYKGLAIHLHDITKDSPHQSLINALVKFSQSGKYYFKDWEILETSSGKRISKLNRYELLSLDVLQTTVVNLNDEQVAAISKPGRNATVDVWDIKLEYIMWSRTFEESIGDVRVYKDHVCILFNENKRISIWSIESDLELLNVPGDSFFGITTWSSLSWDYYFIHSEGELAVTRLNPIYVAKEIPLKGWQILCSDANDSSIVRNEKGELFAVSNLAIKKIPLDSKIEKVVKISPEFFQIHIEDKKIAFFQMSRGLIIHHDPVFDSNFFQMLSESLLVIENKKNEDIKELQLLELNFKDGTCKVVESLQLPTNAKIICNQKTLYIGTSNQLECFSVEALTKHLNFNSVEKREIRNHTPVETAYSVSDKIFTVSMSSHLTFLEIGDEISEFIDTEAQNCKFLHVTSSHIVYICELKQNRGDHIQIRSRDDWENLQRISCKDFKRVVHFTPTQIIIQHGNKYYTTVYIQSGKYDRVGNFLFILITKNMELSGDLRFGSTSGVDYLYSETAAYEFYPGTYHKDKEREFYGLFIERYPERIVYEVGDKHQTALTYSEKPEKHKEEVKELLEKIKDYKGNYLCFDQQGSTALSHAISWESKNFVEFLLNRCIIGTDRKYRYPFLTSLDELLGKYPDLAVNVLKMLPLEKSHPCELGGSIALTVVKDEIFVEGSKYENEEGIWAKKPMKFTFTTPLQAYVVPIPNLCGSLQEKSPLHCIVRSGIKEALENESMKAVLQWKWENYARNIFFKQAFLYFIFCLVYSANAILFSYEDVFKSLYDVYFTSGRSGRARIGLECITAIFLLFYILDELRQFFKEKKRYFKSIWNWLDTSSYILIIASFALHFKRSEWQWFPAAPVLDIRFFLLILTIIVLGFSLAFTVTVRSYSTSFDDILISLLTNYRLIFGDNSSIFDPSIDELPLEYAVLAKILYVVFSFVVSLILLNILIAIMSTSFTTIQENSEKEWRFEFAEIIAEIESHHMWLRYLGIFGLKKWLKRPVKDIESPKWLHVLAAADSSWGKIQIGDPLDALKQEITDQIAQLEKQVTEKFNEVITLIKSRNKN